MELQMHRSQHHKVNLLVFLLDQIQPFPPDQDSQACQLISQDMMIMWAYAENFVEIHQDLAEI